MSKRLPHPSLFSRVTKYRDTGRLSPRENRLTEAFAAVLDEVDGLAAFLATEWCVPDAEEAAARGGPEGASVDIATQQFVPAPSRSGRGGFVDLQIGFRAREAISMLRVEVKHGSPLHGNQLDRYRADGTGVLVLAPRAQLEELRAGTPDEIPIVTWQRTAQLIERFRKSVRSEVHRWLLQQFLQFLTEEGLMAISALEAEHIQALQCARAADDALEEIRTMAFERVRRLSNDRWSPTDSGTWDRWATRRNHFQLFSGIDHSYWSAGCYLECKTVDEGEGVMFRAGITGSRGLELAASDQARELRDRLATGPDWDANADDRSRLVRVTSASSLFDPGKSLEHQGALLAEWVTETFASLSS